MAGNVAQWVADVYRPIVDDEVKRLLTITEGTFYMKRPLEKMEK